MAPVWDPSTGRHLTFSSTLEEGRLPKAGWSKHRRERGHNYAQDRVLVEEDCVSQQLVGGREGTLPGVWCLMGQPRISRRVRHKSTRITWRGAECHFIWQVFFFVRAKKPTFYNYSECPQHVDQTKAIQELILHKMRGRIWRHGFGGWVGVSTMAWIILRRAFKLYFARDF